MIKVEQTINAASVEVKGTTFEVALEVEYLVRALAKNDKEAMDSMVLALSHQYTKERFLELVDNAYETQEVVNTLKEKQVDKLIEELISSLKGDEE